MSKCIDCPFLRKIEERSSPNGDGLYIKTCLCLLNGDIVDPFVEHSACPLVDFEKHGEG